MKLVLLSTDGSSGALRLISDRPYASRDEAFAELRRALSSGEVDASLDLYLLDLDASSPVVIMAAPSEAPAPPAVEPVEEVFGAAAIEDAAAAAAPETLDERTVAAEAVVPVEPVEAAEGPAGWMPQEAEAPTGLGLAGETLSDLPEPVEPLGATLVALETEAELAPAPPVAEEETVPAAPAVVEPLMAAPGVVAPLGAEPLVESPDFVQPLGVEPLMPVPEVVEPFESAALEEPGTLAAEAPAEEVAAEEAPTAVVTEDATLAALTAALTPDDSGEEIPTPEPGLQPVTIPAPPLQWPWEDEGAAQQDFGAEPTEPTGEEGSPLGGPGIPQAAPETGSTSDDGSEAGLQGVSEPAGVTAVAAMTSPATEEPAEDDEHTYEPGALNMNKYTCDDCVYANTCPNKDQKAPAECGSFQWKSV